MSIVLSVEFIIPSEVFLLVDNYNWMISVQKADLFLWERGLVTATEEMKDKEKTGIVSSES